MPRLIRLVTTVLGLLLAGAAAPLLYPPLEWTPVTRDGGWLTMSELQWNWAKIREQRDDYVFIGVGDSRLRGGLDTAVWAETFDLDPEDLLLLTHGGFGRDFQYQRLRMFFRYNRTDYLILLVSAADRARSHPLFERFQTLPDVLTDPERFREVRRLAAGPRRLEGWRDLLTSREARTRIETDWAAAVRASYRPYRYLLDVARNGNWGTRDTEWFARLEPGRGFENPISRPEQEMIAELTPLADRIRAEDPPSRVGHGVDALDERGPFYLRRMVDLAHEHGTEVIFVHLPSLGESRPAEETVAHYQRDGWYAEPADFRALRQPERWADANHLSAETARDVTRELALSLRAQGVTAR